MAKCKSCNAEIIFIKVQTLNGIKNHPVNIKQGSFFIYNEDREIHEFKKGYISHFATCPDADKFRKKS